MFSPAVGTHSTLSKEQAIEWAMQDVTHLPGWDNDAAPNGWNNSLPAIIRCVATVMYDLEYGNTGKPSLRAAFQDGYRTPQITKGFHQREQMISFVLQASVWICHVTVRLMKGKKGDYKTIHIYVTADGRIAGATLWNVQLNQPVS